MTSDDLKQLLQTMATEGTAIVELDEHDLVPRIRRRRRRRMVVTGIASSGTAAVIAFSVAALLPSAGTDSPVANREDGQAAGALTPLPPYKCGVTIPAPSSIGTPGEKVTPKTMVRSSSGWSGSVQAEVTNVMPRNLPVIGGLPTRTFAVVQKNKVVGHATLTVTEKPVRLLPGESHTSQARIDIRGCDEAAGARLPIGSYLLYRDYPADSKPSAGWTRVEALPTVQLQLK